MFGNCVKRSWSFFWCWLNHIEYRSTIYVGRNVKVVSRLGGVLLDDDVIVHSFCRLYSNNLIKIGNHSEIGEFSTISAQNEIIIGNGVLTGPHVFVSDHNHNYLNPNQHIYLNGVLCNKNDKVIIGEGSWIGTNAVIVGNVRIGKNCVIGANAVVTHDIPDYSVAVGVPAKVVRQFDVAKGIWIKL